MTIQAAPDDGEHVELSTEDVQPDIVDQAAGPAPVLITEREVLLGTAAALPPPRATRDWGWWTAAWHRVVAAAASQPRPAPRHDPRRSPSYFESSIISREGYRL